MTFIHYYMNREERKEIYKLGSSYMLTDLITNDCMVLYVGVCAFPFTAFLRNNLKCL